MKPAEMPAATTKAYSLGTIIVRDMVEFKIALFWYLPTMDGAEKRRALRSSIVPQPEI